MVSSTFEDNVTGIRYVYLLQAYKGIPVFNQMTILSFRNGKLLSRSGIYDPNLEKMVAYSEIWEFPAKTSPHN
ncbi:MAG: hypothetical protein IPL50_19225 [Chitinophagaceae bacterium]|nr:hypothetical protein [Chitinophagaceae bacterium]